MGTESAEELDSVGTASLGRSAAAGIEHVVCSLLSGRRGAPGMTVTVPTPGFAPALSIVCNSKSNLDNLFMYLRLSGKRFKRAHKSDMAVETYNYTNLPSGTLYLEA